MARLVSRQAARPEAAAGEPDPGPPDRLDPPDPAVVLLGARIGATARRNALLLEHAWATDAALLRILATAARSEAEAARGTGYARPAAPPPADAIPAGWLDRQA